MDRECLGSLFQNLRFPHTRGDGPDYADEIRRMEKFSPHPWGWTVMLTELLAPQGVFPTPVGMDQGLLRACVNLDSFPHTRGDGPELDAMKATPVMFSPHPWGWTD